jgi:hypothetical protein
MKNRFLLFGTTAIFSQILLVFSLVLYSGAAAAVEGAYDAQLTKWKSHEDVAKWLKSNFVFDKSRQSMVQAHIASNGPENVLTRKPQTFFEKPSGHCRDSAAFARDALNKISPEYNARYIFIKNKSGPPNHWVTGFKYNNKIYVIDYGAGPAWWQMEGVHGPYDNLDGYKEFLAALNVKHFSPEFVRWRDVVGQED